METKTKILIGIGILILAIIGVILAGELLEKKGCGCKENHRQVCYTKTEILNYSVDNVTIKFSYNFTKCADKFSKLNNTEIFVKDNTIKISHNGKTRRCWKTSKLWLEKEGNTLKVYEDLLGYTACVCRGCVCAHHIDAEISNLTPGKFGVEILTSKIVEEQWREFKYYNSTYEKIYEKEVEI